jgi:hypothetical protein
VRPKRRTGDQLSKLSDKLAALAGKKCIAQVIRDEHGDVFMVLMADGWPGVRRGQTAAPGSASADCGPPRSDRAAQHRGQQLA